MKIFSNFRALALCFLFLVSTFPPTPVHAGSYIQTYVEGNWTPVLNFGGATTGITYGIQQGRYTRIGRMVFCHLEITLTSKGSATGAATITGLPYTSLAAPRSTADGLFVTMTLTSTVTAQVTASATSLTLFVTNAGATALANDTNFANTTTLQITIAYMV